METALSAVGRSMPLVLSIHTSLMLLARIASVLANANVNVESAKINTLGERAEDVFLIDGNRLHDEQALLKLETALYEQLRVQDR